MKADLLSDNKKEANRLRLGLPPFYCRFLCRRARFSSLQASAWLEAEHRMGISPLTKPEMRHRPIPGTGILFLARRTARCFRSGSNELGELLGTAAESGVIQTP